MGQPGIDEAGYQIGSRRSRIKSESKVTESKVKTDRTGPKPAGK